MFASTYKKREKAGRRLKGTDPLLQPVTINPGTEPQLQPCSLVLRNTQIISLHCPRRAQSSGDVRPLTLGCPRCGGHGLTCTMASFLNTHK